MEIKSGKVYDLIRRDGLMTYNYRPGIISDYLTENEMLARILTTHGVSPFIWDGRIRLQLQGKGEHTTFRIHDLAYACYHGIITSYDAWRQELQAFIDWKRFYDLTVDHADSNGHNNTELNLSIMSRRLNQEKSDIVARFKAPVYLATAYIESKYRVMAVWNTVQTNIGAGCAAMKILCKNADEYVNCLRSLSTFEPEWHHALRDSKGWKQNDNPCAFSDIGKSIAAQIELSQMNRGEFDLYHLDGLQGRLDVKKVERIAIYEPSLNWFT